MLATDSWAMLPLPPNITTSTLLLSLAASFPVYILLLSIYRLLFHPLRSFPGPRLAALSYWYEFYYDVSPNHGRFIFHILDLHKVYGPIVRINPNELHISDPEYFDTIYQSDARKRTDRDRFYNLDFLGQGLAFTTSHDLHAIRRNALMGYFSQRSVNKLEHRIARVIEGLVERFQADVRGEKRGKESGTEQKWQMQRKRKYIEADHDPPGVENMYYVGSAVAFDVVTDYAFGRDGCTDFMDREDGGRAWCEMTQDQIKINPFSRQFKWVMWLMINMPFWFTVILNPNIEPFIRYYDILVARTKQAIAEAADYDKSEMASRSKHAENTGSTTVFHELVHSDLPPAEKSLTRLTDEAQMIVGAGGETTAQVISRAFYHILANPDVLDKLRTELMVAIPDATVMPALQTLQNLPYLAAVVEEAVRISLPVPARSPRVFPDQDLRYKQWVIPRGNSVSISPYVVSTGEDVFPEPFKFRPERWLGESGRELLRYAVTFGRGRRGCLGKSLAYAELLFTIGVSFRRFEFELYETTKRDVTVVHDFFIGQAEEGSKGVRLRVVKELE